MTTTTRGDTQKVDIQRPRKQFRHEGRLVASSNSNPSVVIGERHIEFTVLVCADDIWRVDSNVVDWIIVIVEVFLEAGTNHGLGIAPTTNHWNQSISNGCWEILWGLLGTKLRGQGFCIYAIPLVMIASETIRPNSMPIQRNCTNCMI